jgi:hypothetical protein
MGWLSACSNFWATQLTPLPPPPPPPPPPLPPPLQSVKASCEWIAGRSRHVRVDDAALARFSSTLAARTRLDPPAWDEGGWHFSADAAAGGPLTAQYVLVLDALNFCFWPSPSGLEYDALAIGLRKALEADPAAFSAERLARVSEAEVAAWVAAPHILPALPERVARIREVGEVLGALYGGSAFKLVAAARNSAVELVRLVASSFPGFRDEGVFQGRHVCFYKRAQIVVADVWAAYGRQRCGAAAVDAAAGAAAPPPFAFHDIDALTCFADYRLPQLLRGEGVLVYAQQLAEDVDARRELRAGGEEEMEIRAATVVVVERLRDLLGTARRGGGGSGGDGDGKGDGGSGAALAAVEVDWYLWQEGERRKDEDLAPHHRVLTCFY